MISLSFFAAELHEVQFHSPFTNAGIKAIRGRVPHPGLDAGTFPWTTAVQAMTLLFLTASVSAFTGEDPAISGTEGSPAASLDYSIAKNTQWLSDVFGSDSNGKTYASRVFRRINSNRKRPGPVTVALNQMVIPIDRIKISADGLPLQSLADLKALQKSVQSKWQQAPFRTNTLAKAA